MIVLEAYNTLLSSPKQVYYKNKGVSGIFSGNLIDAHLTGARELDNYVRIPFREEADIVITTNGGYPPR